MIRSGGGVEESAEDVEWLKREGRSEGGNWVIFDMMGRRESELMCESCTI